LDHQQRRSGQQQRSPTRRGQRIAMKTNSGINRFRNWQQLRVANSGGKHRYGK